MFSVLNTLLEYAYFCISKNITSYTFLLIFKIAESLQCILKLYSFKDEFKADESSSETNDSEILNFESFTA